MKNFLFLLISYIFGFISAIPVGAVQLEVARRALQGHLRSALMVSAGAVVVDILYGMVAFFGLLPVLKNRETMAWFWLMGGVLLIFLSVSVVKQSLNYHDFSAASYRLKNRSISFVTGVSLSLTNPMMILWWLLGERIVVELGLVSRFTHAKGIEFLFLGGAGMLSYPGLLAFTLHWLKRFIPQKTIMKITLLSGIFILCFSLYLIIKSLIYLI
jgi:threonine/homoserine/homoserine lactone efflux protein